MSSHSIPKIIWQTHEWEYQDLPKNFLATLTTWKNLNPDWEHRYASASHRALTVRNFDTTLYRFYSLCAPVTQADIWRYVVIYSHGGVYADMDSICTMPLDYLLEAKQHGKEVVATNIESDGCVNNANFAAIKQSSIFRSILNGILERYEDINYYSIISGVDTKEAFWELLKIRLGLSPEEYYPSLMNQKDLVSFEFSAAAHDEGLKTKFEYDHLVSYYGVDRYYSELAKENNWKTYIERIDNPATEQLIFRSI